MAVKFICKFYNLIILSLVLISITIVDCTFETGSDSSSSSSVGSNGNSSPTAAAISSSSANSANAANDKKQEKLINILENLQYSISEILNTLGTPGSPNQGGSSRGGSSVSGGGGSRTGKSDSSVGGGGGSGRISPPFSQRIEPSSNVKDYTTGLGSREGSSRGIKDEKPPNGLNDADSPPAVAGGRAAVTPGGDPKKHFPGVAGTGPLSPFRVSIID